MTHRKEEPRAAPRGPRGAGDQRRGDRGKARIAVEASAGARPTAAPYEAQRGDSSHVGRRRARGQGQDVPMQVVKRATSERFTEPSQLKSER